jgi:hypothetical protein
MEERAGRDFMITQKNKLTLSLLRHRIAIPIPCMSVVPAFSVLRKEIALLLLFVVSFLSCTPDLYDDPIPPAIFEDIVLPLTLPENNGLATLGFRDLSLAYPNAGVRGIIVYRKNSTTYLAFEKNCSYQPNSACATVNVHSSTFFLEDPCCASTFSWDGFPSGGPAWQPLRQYVTILNGTVLTITDDIVF